MKSISRDGKPIEISLASGRSLALSQGDLRIEAWTEDHSKDAKQRYNWRCRVSVPNGGLFERKGRFDFEAPVGGYRVSDEIVMRQTADPWSPHARRGYFVRLADGRFGRVQFDMFAGGDHFFKIESYLNPTPGSRNLEFDPKKLVKNP